MKQILLALIALYRRYLSPLKGPTCRFYTSCSQYTHDAVTLHGVTKGLGLGLGRIARCHPWNPGGVDLVPPVKGLPTEP